VKCPSCGSELELGLQLDRPADPGGAAREELVVTRPEDSRLEPGETTLSMLPPRRARRTTDPRMIAQVHAMRAALDKITDHIAAETLDWDEQDE
jgi:hypothetical protein